MSENYWVCPTCGARYDVRPAVCTPEQFAEQERAIAAAWEIHNHGLAMGKQFQSDALLAALTALVHEAEAVLGLGIAEIVGETNASCLHQRIQEAQAVIATAEGNKHEERDQARRRTTT